LPASAVSKIYILPYKRLDSHKKVINSLAAAPYFSEYGGALSKAIRVF